MTIFSIGHSTRSIEDFIALLRASAVEQLADVRTVPRSRRCPQFNSDALAASLVSTRVAYRHFRALGGLRHPRPGSANTGWDNASFRGYADYMGSEDFAEGLQELMAWAAAAPTAIMCAEAVWWRCHRRLLADALTIRGVDVRHILGPAAPRAHELTAFARVDGCRLEYPA